MCQELGMQPHQKATVQRWLQTMRGIDVEWDNHSARSLRLLTSEPEKACLQLFVTDTLRYLATGVVSTLKSISVLKIQWNPQRLTIPIFNNETTFQILQQY